MFPIPHICCNFIFHVMKIMKKSLAEKASVIRGSGMHSISFIFHGKECI
jgi:hypothetical protein